jgi:hypothetical protein
MDEKTHLDDYTHYSRTQFAELRQTERSLRFAASWAEQRSYLDQAVAILDRTALAMEAQQTLMALVPAEVDTDNYVDMTASNAPFETTHFILDFDRATGAIVRLVEREHDQEWADPQHRLSWLRYQTFNHTDYARFMDQYLARRPDWAIPDFSKPGLEDAAESGFWQPTCSAILHRKDESGDHFVLRFSSPFHAVEQYGCPARFVLQLDLPAAEAAIFFDLCWFDKPANRQPEALWFSFVPCLADPAHWRLHKLGRWIDPRDVVSRGNRHLHAIDTGVAYGGDKRGFTLQSLDAPLVAPGTPALLNFHNELPALEKGVHFNLYNNVWGTNFPMWYDEDARFRFVWRLQKQLSSLLKEG